MTFPDAAECKEQARKSSNQSSLFLFIFPMEVLILDEAKEALKKGFEGEKATIRQNTCEAVAKLICIGKALADIEALVSRYEMPFDYLKAFYLSKEEAALLVRHAANLPSWEEPAAVDPTNPAALEILAICLRQVGEAR